MREDAGRDGGEVSEITKKPWDDHECELCGGSMTVLSETPEPDLYQDGDIVDCENCGQVGQIICDSETPAFVSFIDDEDEIRENLIEKVKALRAEVERLKKSIALTSSLCWEIEEELDYDEPPHKVPSYLRKLRGLRAHCEGTLVDTEEIARLEKELGE